MLHLQVPNHLFLEKETADLIAKSSIEGSGDEIPTPEENEQAADEVPSEPAHEVPSKSANVGTVELVEDLANKINKNSFVSGQEENAVCRPMEPDVTNNPAQNNSEEIKGTQHSVEAVPLNQAHSTKAKESEYNQPGSDEDIDTYPQIIEQSAAQEIAEFKAKAVTDPVIAFNIWIAFKQIFEDATDWLDKDSGLGEEAPESFENSSEPIEFVSNSSKVTDQFGASKETTIANTTIHHNTRETEEEVKEEPNNETVEDETILLRMLLNTMQKELNPLKRRKSEK